MTTEVSMMSENGRVVVPAGIRKAADLRPREAFIFQIVDGGVLIKTQRQAVAEARAVVQAVFGPGRSPSAELIAERRLEAQRE